MSRWKVLEKRPVLKASLFTAYELELLPPGGTSVIHHVIERKPTVTVLPITEDYQVYLVFQYRYAQEKQTLEAVAGFIDEGETPLVAAERELQEETGLTAREITPLLPKPLDIAGSIIRSKSHLFLATGLDEGEPNFQEEEDITLVKMPLSEAVEKIEAGDITLSATINGILLVDRMRKEGKI